MSCPWSFWTGAALGKTIGGLPVTAGFGGDGAAAASPFDRTDEEGVSASF
jgi:hypothetical protein